jgi:hypothetical protein
MRPRTVGAAVLVLASLEGSALGAEHATSTDATAEATATVEATEPPPPPPPRTWVWYGWQTLLLDAAAISTFGVLSALQGKLTEASFAGAYPIYVVGPPLVHALGHRRVAAGAIDFGLRLVPLLTGAIGAAATSDRELGAIVGGFLGFSIAAGVVSLADAFVISWKRTEDGKTAAHVRHPAFGASAVPEPGGATVRFGGVF